MANMGLRLCFVLVLFGGWGMHAGVADAQEDSMRIYRDRAPTVDEVVEALSVPSVPPPEFRVRSIGRVIEADTLQSPESPRPPTLALSLIQFEFDSSDLTTGSKKVLDNVGRALSSPSLERATILIEGHTDAVGNRYYNKTLSEHRAQKVKQYLVNAFGLEEERLRTKGLGEEDLLDASNPKSGENRRVQFVNIQQTQ